MGTKCNKLLFLQYVLTFYHDTTTGLKFCSPDSHTAAEKQNCPKTGVNPNININPDGQIFKIFHLYLAIDAQTKTY